jgi:hypothetical protein
MTAEERFSLLVSFMPRNLDGIRYSRVPSDVPTPLLTAFISDVILVPTASWPGNLIRGTKLR